MTIWIRQFLFLAVLISASAAFADMDLDQLTYKSGTEADKTANIRLDLFSILDRGYNISIDAPVGHGWTFGPTIFHYPDTYSIYGYSLDGLGVSSMKFFNGKAFRSGFYAGPLAYYVQAESYVNSLSGIPHGFEIGGRGGYQQVWKNINVQLGLDFLMMSGLSVAANVGLDLQFGLAL